MRDIVTFESNDTLFIEDIVELKQGMYKIVDILENTYTAITASDNDAVNSRYIEYHSFNVEDTDYFDKYEEELI